LTGTPALELTFLGTGTSFGVPVVGCSCVVCTSSDPRNRRTRHGALLTLEGGGNEERGARRLLVDTPPELRLQLLRSGVSEVDAVWLTHAHADHVHGLDDLRIVSMRTGRTVPVYCPEAIEAALTRRFDYIFDPRVEADWGTTPPELTLHPVNPRLPLSLLGETFLPLEVPHGSTHPLGFRVGPLGYITDAKRLPPEVLERLAGVRVLVLNALWYGDPHPNHFNIEEALEAAATVGAERTYFTHLTHRVGHEALLRELPAEVRPAHDGLRVRMVSGAPLEERITPP
jgi:phosphoribosyl 1,2-cyclic phosphate phosphodiesterase